MTDYELLSIVLVIVTLACKFLMIYIDKSTKK